MKITEKDLIGQLEGFPLEVVRKMVERQVEQEGHADVSEFQDDQYTGFVWDKTPEKHNFWNDVITKRNFDRFFEMYPKVNSTVSESTIQANGLLDKLKKMRSLVATHYNELSASGAITVIDELESWIAKNQQQL